jgi:hypothetical protein
MEAAHPSPTLLLAHQEDRGEDREADQNHRRENKYADDGHWKE